MNIFGTILLWDSLLFLIIATLWVSKISIQFRWIAVGAVLFNLNVLLVLDAFGLNHYLSTLLSLQNLDYNWIGKILALAITLVIISLTSLRSKVGFDMPWNAQTRNGWIGFSVLFCLFAVISLFIPDEQHSRETILYQLTMPSLEEEIFYRGLLWAVFMSAFNGTKSFLGAQWHWGAVITWILFTVIHGVTWNDSGLQVSVANLLFAGVFGLILTWLRLATHTIWAPVLMHSCVNTIWRVL